MHRRQLRLTKHVELVLLRRILLLGANVFGGVLCALDGAVLELWRMEEVLRLVRALHTGRVRRLLVLESGGAGLLAPAHNGI